MATEPPPRKKLKKLKNSSYIKTAKSESSFSYFISLQKRCYGFKTKLLCDPLSRCSTTDVSLSFYKQIKFKKKFYEVTSLHGAVYNIEFSPEDKYVLAACANSDVMVFDPCSQSKVKTFSAGQKDGVNDITFIDERIFATCSDDTTVKLWDIRNTDESIKTLKGHTSWVKNMNYNNNTKQLITSAFDGTLRLWNLDEFHFDNSCKSEIVLEVPFITRCKFPKDFSKLVISTIGYLLVFDKFNVRTIKDEYQDIIKSYSSNVVPSEISKKDMESLNNKLITISEFPEGSKPWCIGSTQISPNGNYILSRYSTNINSEWTVIHDISSLEETTKNKRLVGYSEEPNVASGYIKEPCFSADGRVICSPFGNAIRLFAIDHRNLSDTENSLKEISFFADHRRSVLCTKFANTKLLLTSGCFGGQVTFYEPKIY